MKSKGQEVKYDALTLVFLVQVTNCCESDPM